MKASNVEHKEKRRNWGALRGTNYHLSEDLRSAWEDEPALTFGEEQLDPCYEVCGDPRFGEDCSQLVGPDVVKTTFGVQEESRHCEGSSLEEAYFIGKGSDSVEAAKTGGAPTLIGV